MVAIPQKAAGRRTLPAASLPSPKGAPQLAIRAASPPLEPAGRARRVVRIVRGAEQQVVAFEGEQQIGEIGAGNRNRAGLPESSHQRGIFVGRAARRGAPACPPVHRAPATSMESLTLKGTPHKRAGVLAAR